MRAVLFDLDGTLLDRNSSFLLFLHQQKDRFSDILGVIPLSDFLSRILELDAHGHVKKDVVYRQIGLDFNLPGESWKLLFDDFRTRFPHVCVPFPGMHRLMKTLVEKDYALGLITNGSFASQQPKIEGLGIE